MADRRTKRKIICGGCGERVLEDTAQPAYRTMDNGFMRFRHHPVAGSTLTYLCATCYREWDVETDGIHPRV